jgi:hypothetical protein
MIVVAVARTTRPLLCSSSDQGDVVGAEEVGDIDEARAGGWFDNCRKSSR